MRSGLAGVSDSVWELANVNSMTVKDSVSHSVRSDFLRPLGL